ncbi:hypothetical protein Ancab_004572 [Ancistrocladus abbreviatus]
MVELKEFEVVVAARGEDNGKLVLKDEGVMVDDDVQRERILKATKEKIEVRGGSLVLDIGDPSKNILAGQTLKRPFWTSHSVEEEKCGLKEDLNYDLKFRPDDVAFHGSSHTLEVITGPSRGLCHSLRSTNASKLPLTLGRNSPSDLLLKDLEVSGKHAMINWNLNKLKWELVDMGSLNGTLLNSKAVNHPNSRSRHWGDPVELASGDIITLGTTTQVHVIPLTSLVSLFYGCHGKVMGS